MMQRTGETSSRSGISTRILVVVIVTGIVLYRLLISTLNAQAMRQMQQLTGNVRTQLDRYRNDSAVSAWWLAGHPDVIRAVEKGETNVLKTIPRDILDRAGLSRVTVWDSAGTCLVDEPAGVVPKGRASDPGSIAREALQGRAVSGVEENSVTTNIVLRAACPVLSEGRRLGAVRVEMNVFGSHAFVDGIGRQFDLVCSVFMGTTRISTTIVEEGKRVIGTTLTNKAIIRDVLEGGGESVGRTRVMGREYDAVYWPLKDVQGRTIGLIGIGKDREGVELIAHRVAAGLGILGAALWLWSLWFRRAFRLRSLVLLLSLPALIMVTALTGVLLYRDLHATILSGFDRKMLALNTTVASCVDGDELVRVLDKADPKSMEFLRFARPLREIMRRKEITYLYTFTLGGTKDITYLVDASPGEDFCAIGAEENVPPQNLEGLRRVVRDGVPYIGGIQQYERWGLLKVSAAPVLGADGRVRALSGVDINISVINQKTRVAIFQLLGLGALSLVLAALISWRIARRLVGPIATVKDGALRVAAGQYVHQITVSEPRELQILAGSFNRIAQAIDKAIETAVHNNEKVESARRLDELGKLIGSESGLGQTRQMVWRWVGGRPDCNNVSGCLVEGDQSLIWDGGIGKNVLDAVTLRNRVVYIARLIAQEKGIWEAALELRRLFPDNMKAVFAVDTDRGIVRVTSDGACPAMVILPSGELNRIVLRSGAETHLEQGHLLVLILPAVHADLPDLSQLLQKSSGDSNAAKLDILERMLIQDGPSETGRTPPLIVLLSRKNPI